MQLKNEINKEVRRIIRSGKSGSAQKIREAFEKIGWDPKTLKPRVSASSGKRAIKSLGKLGKSGLKALPFIGAGVGLYAAGDALSEGEYGTAALELIGIIPGIGDYVDALRFSVELGSVIGPAAYDIINPPKGTMTQLPQIFGNRKVLRYKEGHIGGTIEFISEEGETKVISKERLCNVYNVCNL